MSRQDTVEEVNISLAKGIFEWDLALRFDISMRLKITTSAEESSKG